MTIGLRIKRLGLTQTEFAALIGVGLRTVSTWVTGVTQTPEPVERLLTLLERVPGAMEELRQIMKDAS